MAKRKTKYTMRDDGRIVMTKVIGGKRKYFYGSSDSEVEKKCREYEAALAAAPKCRTFEQVADDYWEQKEPKLARSSVNGFKVAVERSKEEWGDMLVCDVEPQDVYLFLNRLAIQGRSRKTVNNYRGVLRGIFDNAFLKKEISVNPTNNLPQIEAKGKVKRHAAGSSDIQLVIQHRNDSDMGRMFFVMAYAGLRRGEAVGLQYKHIDFEKKQLHVCQSCSWDGTKPFIKPPKTEAGDRIVDLIDAIIEILPKDRPPEEYVFFPAGLPPRRILEGDINRYRRATGITATAHQLRHSYATFGHGAGVDAKDMQHQIGHSSIVITQDIYTEIEESKHKSIRDDLNAHYEETTKKTK